jgi:hypothetical protein
VFENFKTWLSNIYKKIKGSSIDVKLTPEIREVFDNMLGAKLEAKSAQAPAKEEDDKHLTDVIKAVLDGQRLTPTNGRVTDLLAKWRESDKELTAQDIIGIIPMPEGRATRIANSLSDRLNKAENKKKAAEEKAKQEKKVMLPASILSSMVKALKEGMTTDLIAEAGVKALKRLKRYKTMSEQERQAITDEINKKAGVPRPGAPSAQQVLGIESTQELVDEMEVLNEKLQAQYNKYNEDKTAFSDLISSGNLAKMNIQRGSTPVVAAARGGIMNLRPRVRSNLGIMGVNR